MIEVARKYGVELACANLRQESGIDSKKKRERQSLSLSQTTQAGLCCPDRNGLLQEVLIDVRLICTFHLDQANGAFCDPEDCMVNIHTPVPRTYSFFRTISCSIWRSSERSATKRFNLAFSSRSCRSSRSSLRPSPAYLRFHT